MKNLILFVIFLIIVLGCKNDLNKKFYSNGILTKEVFYNSANDTVNYCAYNYYSNGTIKSIIPYKNNLINGTEKSYLSNGELYLLKTYKNGELNGLSKQYDKRSNKLIKETLYISNFPILGLIHGSDIDSDTLFGITYFYSTLTLNDSIFQPVGSIIWDSKGNKVPSMLTYFEICAKDTIKEGEAYKIDIEFHLGTFQDLSFELTLGEFDCNFSFKNNTKLVKYQSVNNKLTFTYAGYSKGDNLMLGKIRLFSHGKDVTYKCLSSLGYSGKIDKYIFFHQFYVN
jgi:hypothetical protein